MAVFNKSKSRASTKAKEESKLILEKGTSAKQEDLNQYQNKLQTYFISGQITDESLKIKGKSLILTHYLRNESPDLNFPYLYNQENGNVNSFYKVVYELIHDYFISEEAEILSNKLNKILSNLEEKINKTDQVNNYIHLVNKSIDSIKSLSAEFKDEELFKKQCDQVKGQLLSRKVTLLEYGVLSPFQLLNQQLIKRKVNNLSFLKILKKGLSALDDILQLNDNGSKTDIGELDFAEDLISFDKIDEISISEVSSSLPKQRLNRIQDCRQTLSLAYNLYSKSHSTVFASKILAEEFKLKKHLKGTSLKVLSEGVCENAYVHFKKQIQEFVEIIAALRLADLEANQTYDENLHAVYFDNFELSNLSDEDLKFFLPLIVVENSNTLLDEANYFLKLLSEGSLVKIMSINNEEDLSDSINKKYAEQNYLELASLAIIRRNVFLHQGGIDTPEILNKAIVEGLDLQYPALWNILVPKLGISNNKSSLIFLKTAIRSRYFPSISFNPSSGVDFGNSFDLSANFQYEKLFPSFIQEIETPSGIQNLEYSLTIADFFAMRAYNMQALEILPAKYQNEDLISLTEYLKIPQELSPGKIPFIWIVDEEFKLNQAPIPRSWLHHIRSRLDYWNFLKNFTGIQSKYSEQSIEEAKLEWTKKKEAEIKELQDQLNTQFQQSRNNDLEKGIKRMLNALVDGKYEISPPKPTSNNITSKVEEEIKSAPESIIEEKSEEIVLAEIKSEAWVESDECTSCNDCIDALPGVFKYNSDKQAYVHNPKGGPFAKIVSTAEKCPAACIHPGKPHDSNEKGLEKWIKRAEKYN